jgi:hypothetical protein
MDGIGKINQSIAVPKLFAIRMSVTREATAADAVIWTAAGMTLREARFVSRRETFIIGITRIVNIGITLRIDTKANSVVAAQSNGG